MSMPDCMLTELANMESICNNFTLSHVHREEYAAARTLVPVARRAQRWRSARRRWLQGSPVHFHVNDVRHVIHKSHAESKFEL